jgi:hypothetical protein
VNGLLDLVGDAAEKEITTKSVRRRLSIKPPLFCSQFWEAEVLDR